MTLTAAQQRLWDRLGDAAAADYERNAPQRLAEAERERRLQQQGRAQIQRQWAEEDAQLNAAVATFSETHEIVGTHWTPREAADKALAAGLFVAARELRIDGRNVGRLRNEALSRVRRARPDLYGLPATETILEGIARGDLVATDRREPAPYAYATPVQFTEEPAAGDPPDYRTPTGGGPRPAPSLGAPPSSRGPYFPTDADVRSVLAREPDLDPTLRPADLVLATLCAFAEAKHGTYDRATIARELAAADGVATDPELDPPDYTTPSGRRRA